MVGSVPITLSGDAGTLQSGQSYTGGNDIFTVSTAVQRNGYLTGDCLTVNGGTLTGGADIVALSGAAISQNQWLVFGDSGELRSAGMVFAGAT
jgi:hypothetical protein